MWKDYSLGYIKNNRSSGLSVMIAAFISALLLSLLCGIFYNLWKYEIERIELEEGGWQSRIVSELDGEDIEFIKNFASVKDVAVSEKRGSGAETAVEIYFHNYGAVLKDTPKIVEALGLSQEAVTYNYAFLAMYLIRDARDTAPRLVFPFFILVMGMASFSLIVIIHNSFAVSMNGRIHQFGIFSSIGATPRQIRACLLQEAAALCAAPVLAGGLLGIVISMGEVQMSNILLGKDVAGRHEAVFGYHPWVLGVTLLVTVLTIWISAWMPAWKLSRQTPLEAIKSTGELQLKRRKKSPLLALLFGTEGELAGNALKAQRKALRTASLSLVFSFLAFTLMQCFFTLSEISRRESYFERYQKAWDIMVTVKDAEADSFGKTEEIQGLPGVESAIVYQKAAAKRIVTEEEMSEEMKAFGGFSHACGNASDNVNGSASDKVNASGGVIDNNVIASGKDVTQTTDGWLVNAPIVILDDHSFLAYCEQIGVAPQLEGAVILNQIRDVTNPDFRHPQLMPYIKEEGAVSVLRQSGNEEIAAQIPVLSYTEEVPVLREEYATLDHYEMVHFVPVSLWKEIKDRVGGWEEDSYIRILGGENVTLEQLNALQDRIDELIGQAYRIESENRIQEYDTNNKIDRGMKAVLGGFCVLLAIIGIGNVFSNTLGFVRQRKREFARYMSVGLTPAGIRKMFCIEAMVIAGRPVLITLPIAVIAVWCMLRMCYVGAGEFLAQAPLVPIVVFMAAILGPVALAYYLGWRSVRGISLGEVLRDDTMM